MNYFTRIKGDKKKTALYKSKERKPYASMPVFTANYNKPVRTLLLSFVLTLLLLILINNNMNNLSLWKNDRAATPQQQVKLVSSIQSTQDGVIVGDSTSVFNCGGPNGRCVYFYPTHFFNPEVGEGKTFRYILEHIDELRKRNELWRNMPRIGFPTFSYNEQVTNTMTNETFHRHNVTLIHVHKAGGTTIHNFAFKAKTFQIGVTRHPLYQWRQEQNAMPGGRNQLAYFHLSTAGTYKKHPEQWGSDDHVMFAFLRDPLERFISSIGQAMGADGSQKNVVGEEFQSKCINGTEYSLVTSRNTLQCCIDYVKKRGYYFEVHFTPQAVEIGFATQMYPIPVAIFKFEDSYQTVLTEMGINPNKKHRDGDQAGYRPSPVLTGMTSADYTPELIRQICELYEVDVIMHRSLGWDVPRCHGYV